jgi:transposase
MRKVDTMAPQPDAKREIFAWIWRSTIRRRRINRRWKVERLFAWMQNYRRLVTRWEYHIENFFGFVHLACLLIPATHL